MSEKTYCLFFTCGREECSHNEYIVADEKITLEEAKKKYPNVKFCEDWIQSV